jgi:AraC-like DNA-binding protein
MHPKLIPFVSLILLLGLIQGILLSINLIFTKDDKRQAKYFLATLILLIVLELFRSLWYIFQTPDYEVIHFLFLCLILTFPPSLFLYIRAMIQTEKLSLSEIFKAYFFNLIIFIITVLVLVVQFNLTNWRITGYYSVLLKILLLISFWIYYRKSQIEFDFFNNNPVSDISEVERQMITKWLNLFLKVIFYIALLWTSLILLQMLFSQKSLFYIFIFTELVYVIAIYWIGYTGFQRIKVIYLSEQKNTQTFFNSIQKSEKESCLAKLIKAMEVDCLYLDTTLTLQKMASHIGVSHKIISAVLNQQLAMGFNEYVNHFRVEEFKKRILDPQNAHLNIAGVAFDSGFNSLATFQRSFKTITGITPKEFMKLAKKD